MSGNTVTLNADGSLTEYAFAPDGTLVQTHTDVAMVKTMVQMVAGWVLQDTAKATLTPSIVTFMNLAVADGLVTDTQVKNWAVKYDIQVKDIFLGTPSQTGATKTESFVTAANDRLVTGNAPTLIEAQAHATIASQQTSPDSSHTGPTVVPGADPIEVAVQGAYVAYYGRPADVGGLHYWEQQLKNVGGNLDAIIDAFGNSAESRALYASQSAEEQVTKVYQQMFGRDPEAGGKAFWLGQIGSGQVSLAEAALAIFNGASGGDKLTINNKLVVSNAFTDVLIADGTAQGLYVGNVAAGNARDYLFAVDADASKAIKLAGLAQDVAHHIQSGIDGDLAGIGIQVPLHLMGVVQAPSEWIAA